MKKIDPIRVTKKIATLVVGAGTTSIVSSIIENNTAPESVTDKVKIKSASVVIGLMVADKTEAYTSDLIDGAVKFVKDVKAEIGKSKTA